MKSCEVSWFSALCDDDYEFLGQPDPALKSSFEHCRNIVQTAETGGFDNILLPSGYALGIDSTAFAAAVAVLTQRIKLLLAVRVGEAWPPQWCSLTLMFQQEVAARIVGAPYGDAYGRLAVLAQWRSEARIAMKVHRSAFTPPPKVMSAIVHIVPAEMPAGVSPRKLERLTEAAFGQRRKMLRQSVKGLPGALEALAALGIDTQRRAETLTVGEFVSVARFLSSQA